MLLLTSVHLIPGKCSYKNNLSNSKKYAYTHLAADKWCFPTLSTPHAVPDDQFRQVSIQARDEIPLTPSTSIELKWSPDIQPFEDPQSYRVDIAAYFLDPQEGTLEMVKMLASDVPNTGKATVRLDEVQLQRGTVVAPLYVQVAVARTQTKKSGLPAKACSWSAVTYFTTHTAILIACNYWSLRQRDVNSSVLLDQVEPCPRTVAQARLPNSNFIADDVDPFGRHIQTSSVFHPSADICFRQRVPKWALNLLTHVPYIPSVCTVGSPLHAHICIRIYMNTMIWLP